jgi:heptosyltransferase III
MREIERIVIFRQGQFGDTLVVFPVIEALNQIYPTVPLLYVTNNFKSNKYVQGRDVALLSPHLEEIITYNVEDSVVQKYISLKKSLKVSKHDLLIYLPYSTVRRYQVIRDWVFFKTLNFKNIICFKETWKWTYIYEKKEIELPKESDRMLKFLSSAGIPVEFSGRCSLNCDEEWAGQKWNEWGLNGKGVLAVCPGSKMQSKRWPMERYIEVGKKWHKKTGMSLLIIGGPEETKLANEIISHWSGYGFSACGANLNQTAGILQKVNAYCGNDTGSMHLAALLGIPCVAIFSSRAPAKLWYPYGDKHIILRKVVDCENCELENCYTALPVCLDKISIKNVLDALLNICKINSSV